MKPARWLLIATVFGIAATSACGSPAPNAAYNGVNVGVALAVGGRGDEGINDLSGAGLYRAQRRLGVHFSRVALQQQGNRRVQRLDELVRNKLNPVLAVGDAYADDLADVARRHRNTTFAVVDSVEPHADNIVNLAFAEEQGSYLMGVVAARKSVTGRVGFIGGSNDVRTRRYQAGFAAGVKSVAPATVVDVRFVTGTATDTGQSSRLGRNSPTAARQVADQLLRGGADVLYQAAGNSGSGVFDAVVSARARGDRSVWAIGSDTDQGLVASAVQKEVILTSMVKRCDNAVYAFVADYLDGGVRPGLRRFTLADDGMSFATSGEYLAKYKLLDELQRVKTDITKGRVRVPSTV